MADCIYSMTGYGRAEKNEGDWQVLVEVKSLNGKQFELNLKIPPLLKSFEFQLRNQLANSLNRGTIECTITLKLNGTTKPAVLNLPLIRSYFHSLKEIGTELNMDTSHILGALMRLPEVVQPVTEDINEEGWELVQATVNEAINLLMQHRAMEGEVLGSDIEYRLKQISVLTAKVEEQAAKRPGYLKENLLKKTEEALGKGNYDTNRLEQEIIYYLEKYDISEELTRLKNHCDYFILLINDKESAKGKRLGFLLQEVGREINTTGAKAYDAEMQKLVVAMKDELEKAKEQLLNVL